MNLVWLRNDLRLNDNPALHYAAKAGPVCCVYTITPKQWRQHQDAPAKIALWRARVLALSQELGAKSIPLKLITANTYQQVPKKLLALAQELSTTALWFNYEYPLNETRRDQQVTKLFSQRDIAVHHYHGDVIHPPGSVTTQSDKIYHVYSPFARQWRKQVTESLLEVLPAPRKQSDMAIDSDDLETLWPLKTTYREDLWPSTTNAIRKKLRKFADGGVTDYKQLRDFPGIVGTSALSPYLMCGALSVRQCIAQAREQTPDWLENAWVNELIWREFYRHLTASYPHLSRSEDFKATSKPIPWDQSQQQWQAWCRGETGYPIVDAAIKQLLQTGWMHNRLRMIVAAFLTKLLLIDWRQGEAFFMAHLIDGDYASNNGGWQWAASTGADSVPYFRIFNPQRQSENFDPEGKFIRKFLPELAALDNKSIHNPSDEQRRDCGYPAAIVDYKFARQRALDVYAVAMGK